MTKYQVNKKKKARLLGTSSLACHFTKKEVKGLLKGYLPEGYNCHHILPKCDGGTDDINNLSIMEIEKHNNLHKYLSRIKELGGSFGEVDRPFLTQKVIDHGGVVLN
jgi:hypothetical protein